MNENPQQKAQDCLKRANNLKALGDLDAALTEYRRAVVADPSLFEAHLAIGQICRSKSSTDKMFQRYSFEAFRQAARLNLTHEEAHNQYILAAQQMNLFDSLLDEYRKWESENPENEVIKKCKKNLIAISLVMIPQPVNVQSAKASSMLQKFVFIFSLSLILCGVGTAVGIPLLSKKGLLKKEQMKPMVILSGLFGAAGLGGFVIYSQMK